VAIRLEKLEKIELQIENVELKRVIRQTERFNIDKLIELNEKIQKNHRLERKLKQKV
jgi:hypothetical protein